MIRVAPATTVPIISKSKFSLFKIPLPSLTEQIRIAAVLDKAAEVIETRKSTLKTIDALKSSLFIEMFGNPVTNPMGWKVKKLGEVGTLERGVSKHRPRNAPELLGGKYPLIQTGDIANADDYLVTFKSTYSEIGLKQSKLWEKGTLCITIAANIGKTAILGFDACFPDSVVGFKAGNSVKIEYVQYWIQFIQQWLEDSAPMSAQKNINLEILRNLDIPIPSFQTQEAFTTKITALNTLKAKHTAHLEQLTALFAALQHKAFRGEL